MLRCRPSECSARTVRGCPCPRCCLTPPFASAPPRVGTTTCGWPPTTTRCIPTSSAGASRCALISSGVVATCAGEGRPAPTQLGVPSHHHQGRTPPGPRGTRPVAPMAPSSVMLAAARCSPLAHDFGCSRGSAHGEVTGGADPRLLLNRRGHSRPRGADCDATLADAPIPESDGNGHQTAGLVVLAPNFKTPVATLPRVGQKGHGGH